jgi:hypothetical protein
LDSFALPAFPQPIWPVRQAGGVPPFLPVLPDQAGPLVQAGAKYLWAGTDCTDILFIELSELIKQQASQAINLIN